MLGSLLLVIALRGEPRLALLEERKARRDFSRARDEQQGPQNRGNPARPIYFWRRTRIHRVVDYLSATDFGLHFFLTTR